MTCLLDWAKDTVSSIVSNYVQQGVSAAINQFRYMCCLKKYEEELNQEENALNVVKQEVDRVLSQEAKNTNVPDEPVEDWIKRTKKAMDDTHRLQDAIKEDKRCFNNRCPNWFWRYGRSKEAENLTTTIKNLQEERGKFTKLTHEPTELPNIEFIGPNGALRSKASEAALRDIMAALETDGVNMIGLHGMPGVGKTTLAIQIKEEAERRKLFHDFVKVTVSEKPNMNAIQERIAEQLQLKFHSDDSFTKRAGKLMKRLQDEKKKLLVLDDVWGELKLKEIGIPSMSTKDLDNCKILLTTRRKHVCESMNCQRTILLDILTEDEAWNLFKTFANLEDDSPLTAVARKVAKECGRLPVAIVSVGKALKGKYELHVWERALRKLREGEHRDIRDLSKEENAYRSLKFSFDELEREETKICLLLCSLFPEDYEICVEDLTRYALGLGLYQGARSIEDTTSEVLDALDELQDSHLLLEAEKKGHMKMHDLVRDIVLVIGKSYSAMTESNTKKEFIVGSGIRFKEWPTDGSFKDCAAISMLDSEVDRLPDQLDTPKLEMLLLERRRYSGRSYYPRDNFTDILDKSFEGAEKLQVLSITRGNLSIQSMKRLTNLRTLELRHCNFTSDNNIRANLALLRNLTSLEILSLYGTDIQELPDEIGELKNLKLLELTKCNNLERVPSKMIKKLLKLEELHIGSFKKWDEGMGNATLMNVHRTSLPHLNILSLQFSKKIPGYFDFSNLIGYDIHIGCGCWDPQFQSRLRHPLARNICINPKDDTIRACKNLFQDVCHLCLRLSENVRNLIPDVAEVGFGDLSLLHLEFCKMECLINTSKQKTGGSFLPNLAELIIEYCNLVEICEGQTPKGFLKKLQRLEVIGTSSIVTIFPAKLLQGIQKLENVEIERCDDLQEVFSLDGLDERNKDCLSHLINLKLWRLLALKCIWKGPTDLVNLKSLTRISIRECYYYLKSVFSVSLAQSLEHLDELEVISCRAMECIVEEKYEGIETFSKPHPQQLILQNLKHVTIQFCFCLKYVFPIRMARGLPNLTNLDLTGCFLLEKLFGIEDQAKADTTSEVAEVIEFPKLLELELEGLPDLVAFCPKGYNFWFPSLQKLTVGRCGKMTTSFIAAPDGSVYAKPQADIETGSAKTQVLFHHSETFDDHIRYDCSRHEGEWILQKSKLEEIDEMEYYYGRVF